MGSVALHTVGGALHSVYAILHAYAVGHANAHQQENHIHCHRSGAGNNGGGVFRVRPHHHTPLSQVRILCPHRF